MQLDDGRESDYCLITTLLWSDDDHCAVITPGGEANPDDQVFTYLADNVAVFFSLEEARAARALLHGDRDALPF